MGLYEMLLFTLCRISNNVNSVYKFCISINLVSLMDYILLSILYIVIIYPFIMLGVYKIVVKLNAKTGKL